MHVAIRLRGGGTAQITVTIYDQDESFYLQDNEHISDLKKQIMKTAGIPIERQQLNLKDRTIRDGKRLICATLFLLK